MSSNPLVSVILGTYNQEDFIKETIESVLNQDYQNFELIIADDASIDDTKTIIQAYQNQHPDKIIFINHEKNLGITKNINSALKQCKGKYVVFLGGDDIFLPNKFSHQIKVMESDPSITISYHDVSAFEHATGKELYRFSDRYPQYEGKAKQIIRYGVFYSALSCMLTRSAMPEYGCDERIPICSDWALMFETLIKGGGTFKFIPGVYALYRRHENNLTKKMRKDLAAEELHALQLMKNKHEAYVEEFERREADLYFIKTLKALLAFQLIEAVKSVYKSIKLSHGFWTSPRILINEIKWRTRLRIWNNDI